MRHIGLLRAVNVGGTGTIRMAQLRSLGEKLGFAAVTTLLQSGNLTFETDEANPTQLERRWEKAVEEHFGVTTAFIIRTAPQWQAMIEANPFAAEAKEDPSHLLLLPAKGAIAEADVEALRGAIRGRESVAAGERCLYAVYPDGIGTSKLTTKAIERHLGTLVTGRNWNTVLKLAE
ncbi:DUF1697 domain-containing protein [Labrys okinawensis]|uniref:DUF1697 domain-containing protein n=1 Tax=Labrys okinawensis TaxID=346911 RepID=UPI0039BCBA68